MCFLVSRFFSSFLALFLLFFFVRRYVLILATRSFNSVKRSRRRILIIESRGVLNRTIVSLGVRVSINDNRVVVLCLPLL